MRNLNCLRCNLPLQYLMREKLQLGQTGWFLGDLPNLLSGALELDIYCCPSCGKMEFFRTEESESDHQIAQEKCPRCGQLHDIDDPKCPFCGYQ